MPEVIYCCDEEYQIPPKAKRVPNARLIGTADEFLTPKFIFLHEQDIEDVEEIFERDCSYIRLRTIFHREYDAIMFCLSPETNGEKLIMLCEDYEAISSAVNLKNRLD